MKIQKINAYQAWVIITHYTKQHQQCKSITGIVYHLDVNSNSIFFTAPSRNNGLPIEISITVFMEFFNSIMEIEDINTNSIKDKVLSGLYKKRSLLMAILTSCEIIK